MPRLPRVTARTLAAAVPMAWLTLFFLVPFLIVFKISLSETRLAIPPFAPLFEWHHGWPVPQPHLGNYLRILFGISLYRAIEGMRGGRIN